MIISQFYEVAAEIAAMKEDSEDGNFITRKMNKYNVKMYTRKLLNKIREYGSRVMSNEDIEDFGKVLSMFYSEKESKTAYMDTALGNALIDFSNVEYNVLGISVKYNDGELISIKYNDGELSYSRTSPDTEEEGSKLPVPRDTVNKIMASVICNTMLSICTLMIVNGGKI